MKNKKITRLAYAAAGAVLPFATMAATWLPTASGTYTWTDDVNWENKTLPTGSSEAKFNQVTSGTQIINGNGAASNFDVNTKDVCSRVFTGSITAKYATIRTGTNCISGTLTLTQSADGSYSSIGTSTAAAGLIHGSLDILSGGSVLVEGNQGFCVARNADANTQASGQVRLRDGGRLLLSTSAVSGSSGLMLGKTDGSSTAPWLVASYLQEGGFARIGRLVAAYESCAQGSVTISGGVLDLPYVGSATLFKIGRKGYGIFQQLGGEVYVNTNKVIQTIDLTQSYAFEVGSGMSAANGLTNACFYSCGGKFVNGNAFLIQGPSSSETGVMPASATIDGTAAVTSKTVRVGANTGDGRATLNLNGGMLSTIYLRGKEGRSGVSEVNGDGGTVSFPADAYADQFLHLSHVNIYPGGLTVDCGRDVNFGTASSAATLRAPKGFGFTSITRAPLDGCAYPPRIEITGGSGSNATAIALMDYGRGRLTNIVVTCRGEGYASGDTPTVAIIRINTTNPYGTANITVNLADNSSGALVKTGVGSLSLYAQPEFDGTYEVREGRMIQTTATTGSERVSAIVVGGDGAVFQCGSADATATVARSNPVNTAATLTLGTVNGPGTLAIPAAANGESAAFVQTFASLTVNGIGNTIEMASGNNAANGAKVIFGNIVCPAGATVTIPRWDSPLKVYVTGRPARTVFRNVMFAGTGLHAAVGKDGQLVPAPGMMISFK